MTKVFWRFATLLAIFLMTVSAHTRTPMMPTDINEAVRELLISEAGNITLVDEKDQPFDAYYQLPALIARQLKFQYRQPKIDDTKITFGNTNIDCKVIPTTGRSGSGDYNCEVVIAEHDYFANHGVIGQIDTEGGITLNFIVTREVRPGFNVKMASNKIQAMLAN